MKKKEIKDYFYAIRHSDLPKVIELVQSNSDYLTACNFAPPKKDDGQSGLQVAFKSGNFDIASFLIDQGADVNFIEQSVINEWRAPVLHDCIRATIFNSYVLKKDTTKFDMAFSLMKTMLEKGANPNAHDSYGNDCMNRVMMDIIMVLKHPESLDDEVSLKQWRGVFKALIDAGANPDQTHPDRPQSFAKFIEFERYALYKFI